MLFQAFRIWVFILAILLPAGYASASIFSPSTSWQISGTTINSAKQAFQLADKGKWKEAFAQADKSRDPVVSKIILWRYYVSGQSRNFLEIKSFIDSNPHWPNQAGLLRQAEYALDDSVPTDIIMRWFTRHPPTTAKGMQYFAEAHIAAGLKDSTSIHSTEALLKRAWVDGNFSLYDEKVFMQRHGKRLVASDYNARIDRLLWDDRVEQAKRILHHASVSHKKLFEARIALKHSRSGVDAKVKAVLASLKKDEGLVYDRIKWRKKRKDYAGVRELLPEVPLRSKYPHKWWALKQSQIRDLISVKQYRVAYNLAINHGLSDGKDFAEGEWLAGWIALRFLNDPKTAYEHFYALYHNVNYPISLARAAYWAGRAAEVNNSAKIAQSWYYVAADHSYTFYGQLALAKVDKQPTLKLSMAPKPTEKDRHLLRTNEVAKAAYLLVMTKQRDGVVRRFVDHAVEVSRTGGEKELMGNLMLSHKRYDLAVVASKSASRQGVLLAHSGYPLISEVLGDPKDRARNHAVIRQESEFKHDAKSHAGARGYMQLMPATARMMARETKQAYTQARLIKDGRFNVSLGSRYLEKLLDGYDGSYVLAIASYNAGPGNVRKWIAQNGRMDDQKSVEAVIDWIERIPFSETRNYVHRVLENVQVYEMLLNVKPESMAHILMNRKKRSFAPVQEASAHPNS